MRTKTMLLSALLGTLSSVSLMAQSGNVYSLNAVGYINVTLEPGYNIVSCPLVASPDNTINTLFTNSSGQYKKFQVYKWQPSTGGYSPDTASGSGWLKGGTNTINPGEAIWVFNPGATATNVTFVGTVPSGSLPNPLAAGFNMVSSVLPTSGNIVTNTLMNFAGAVKKDQVFTWNPTTQQYNATSTSTGSTNWPVGGDPVQESVGGGFWYNNNSGAANDTWVENFSVGQ